MTALLGLAVNGFVAPITEELYLRGYLLPRISRFKVWAPLINGGLHSLSLLDAVASARPYSKSFPCRICCLVEKKHLPRYDYSCYRECTWINTHDSDNS